MRDKKTISGENILRKEMRINNRMSENARRNRMKKRLQLHDSLTEYGNRANSFWLLRSRHMNRITHK